MAPKNFFTYFIKLISAYSYFFSLLANVRVFCFNGAGIKSFKTDYLFPSEDDCLFDISLANFFALFLNLSTTCWLFVSENADSSYFDLKYFDILECGFFVNSSNVPYSSVTPSLRIIMWSWGSINYKNFKAITTVFPSCCFCLNISSTTIAVPESIFV